MATDSPLRGLHARVRGFAPPSRERRPAHVIGLISYASGMTTVPIGQQARVLLQLICPDGHPLTVYGRDEETPWAGLIAPRCVKCGQEFAQMRKVADLDRGPQHRFLVRRRAGTLIFEAEIAADRFEVSGDVVTFYTGPHRVTSSAQLIQEPERLGEA